MNNNQSQISYPVMQTHYSWNAKIMPITHKPNWTNTLCGLRAPHHRIDNEKPTCPDCLSEMQKREELRNNPTSRP
jgi:hypothetical protein